MNLSQERQKLLTKSNLEATFRSIDIDNNKKLTINEFKRAFEAGGNERTDKFWQQFIAEVDENQDGEISLEEFIQVMEKILFNEV